MAVLRPDQSQLTIQAEIVPGADSEIIIPDTVHMIDGSSIRGVYFSSSSTDLAVYPSGSATAYNATVEAMDPVLPGAISCYVNPVQYVAVGDFICFEYEDFLLESLPATTDQRSIPYLDALIAGGCAQQEIRRVERIEGASGNGVIYWDRPLAFAHYTYDLSNEKGSSGAFAFTPTSTGGGTWAYATPGTSHWFKAAIFSTLAGATPTYPGIGQKYINLVPGVYETVDTPDFTPVVEPRYFLGTNSNRNFTSVYTGQHSYSGALNGMVLTNGWPLRFAIGKEVPKVYGGYFGSTSHTRSAVPSYPAPASSIVNMGYYAVGAGNSADTGECGIGLAANSNVGDVWICLTSTGWNDSEIGIGHHLLIDYTNMTDAWAGVSSNQITTDITNKIYNSTGSVSNNLEIRQITELGRTEVGAALSGWMSNSYSTQSTWVRLNAPLKYAHSGGGNNTVGWGCRILGYALNETDSTLQTANSGTAFANTYVEHYIQETSDLDSFSMHLHMKDSNETDANDFDRRWIGGKVGSMSIVGEEGGLVTCNWDSIVFLDMIHNQARHASSTRLAGPRAQQVSHAVTASTTPNVPGFAIMHNITSADVVYPTTQPYYFSNGSIKLLGTTGANPVEFARIRSFTLTVNNNVDPRYYIKNRPGDHRGPAEIKEQRREYSLNCTVALPDTASASATSSDSALSLFKELLLEGRYGADSGHQGFHIEMTFSRGEIEGATGVNDEIVIKIPGRQPGETDLSGYSNNATAGIGTQGAFLRGAPHTIMTEAPFQVTCDFVFRNIDIMIRDREPFYP